ncbi:MAG: co-chaperone GroES [Candidatus Fischerbacteria bacterium RBG_13_37_8]|uniref:Co-chaperonin GroES n=1 Tax=Candidatus Fischerbacteria bacterium RBG_13_37_8 TaxID=1817863 RepID=A0A1F5VKX3_9BACT|nr:MAG: co-chaperone GroES [Candidatus Fischerbacteria bacterium RBG_13_37_8]
MDIKIRPLHDRVLAKRLEEKEQIKGGIIIPDTAKEKPQQAKILAVGKGKMLEDGKVIPLDVKEGDIVLISKYAGTEIKMQNEEYLILREDEILGIIQD